DEQQQHENTKKQLLRWGRKAQEAEAKYQNQVAALVKPPRFVGQESILAVVVQSQAIAQNANRGLRED
ncbi:unnamed protein product, partial [Effrenium voratum]